MTVPNLDLIQVPCDDDSLREVIDDLCIKPRQLVRKWATITNQTGQAKLSYVGQHIASVLTGVKGVGTAARGLDLRDNSEVKTCSRADQLGKCKKEGCDGRVMSFQEECPLCGGTDIRRKTDSHWIIAIRKQEDLEALLARERIVLLLFDREAETDPNIRLRAWEIWPKEERHQHFTEFMTNYFDENYSVKLDKAAPANFHPLKFDFYMCNPVRTLRARLVNPDGPGDPAVEILERVAPDADRATLPVEPMPVTACKPKELEDLLAAASDEVLAECLRPGKTVADLRAAVTFPSGRVARVAGVMDSITEEARRSLAMREKRVRLLG